MKQRHIPLIPVGRTCWVCGKSGGSGFTRALKLAGYAIVPGKEIGYAHNKCMARALHASAKQDRSKQA